MHEYSKLMLPEILQLTGTHLSNGNCNPLAKRIVVTSNSFENINRPLTLTLMCNMYRIWSWCPTWGEKHGPKELLNTNRGRIPGFLLLMMPGAMLFGWHGIQRSNSIIAGSVIECSLVIQLNIYVPTLKGKL